MNRREFLKSMTALGVYNSGWTDWFEQGFFNPCLTKLPESLAHHPVMQQIWQGIDPAQVRDSHVHLIGSGDADTNAWLSPQMDSYWHPLLKVQKHFYMNASCIEAEYIDQSYITRLLDLLADMRPGFKLMLYAFDWFHDDHGAADPNRSIFHIPNQYAAHVAQMHPDKFEWVASIHPYRADCVDALQRVAQDGAKAIKWLPSAMGIDPLSPQCDRFYQALAATGIKLISHAGRELAVQGGNQDHGNPLRLRRALDHGVKVVIAHCASDGDDLDLDQGSKAEKTTSFQLFTRMMDEPRYAALLYADISALTQINRVWALKSVLQRREWQSRLLNGSDYPLPGVMPLFSAAILANMDLLDPAFVPVLQEIRQYNPLLFDFALKRLLRFGDYRFAPSVFETRRFFEV